MSNEQMSIFIFLLLIRIIFMSKLSTLLLYEWVPLIRTFTRLPIRNGTVSSMNVRQRPTSWQVKTASTVV